MRRPLARALVALVALLTALTVVHAQGPKIPPPGTVPAPSVPSAPVPAVPVSPPTAPTSQTPAQPQGPAPPQPPQPPNATLLQSPRPRPGARPGPDLDQCRFALRRMLAVLLLELFVEFGLVIMRFLVEIEILEDWDLIKMTIIRASYLIFVVPLNVGVLWMGYGHKSSCLSAQNEVRIAFALLIFFTLFVAMHVLLLALELKYDEDDSDYDYSDEYDDRRSRRRRRRHSRSSSASGPPSDGESFGHEPKFNLGRLFGLGR